MDQPPEVVRLERGRNLRGQDLHRRHHQRCPTPNARQGNMMDNMIAKRLAYLADFHCLLPSQDTGERKLASDPAIHFLLQRTQQAWSEGRVASLLLDQARKRMSLKNGYCTTFESVKSVRRSQDG